MFKAVVLNLLALTFVVLSADLSGREKAAVSEDLGLVQNSTASEDTAVSNGAGIQRDDSEVSSDSADVEDQANSQEVSEDTIVLGGSEGVEAASEDTVALEESEEEVETEFVEEQVGLEKMPELTEFVEADYPDECVLEGIEGAVLLELLVNEKGMVDSAAVVNGLHPLLDSSAAEAVRRFTFSPAVAGGENVAVMLQYEYRFSLREAISTPDEYVNFKGRILERGTRKPLAEAMVVVRFPDTLCDTSLGMPFSLYLEQIAEYEGQSLEDDRLVALTDSNGHFSFSSLPDCSVEVTLPVSGYEPFRTGEKLSTSEVVEANYYLRRHSYSDFEVTAYGRVEEKEVSRHQLTVAEVKKIPGLGGDAVKVVQALPGVGRPSLGGTDVIVRGAPTWDSRYFLDGVSIPLIYHFGGLKSVYNSDALESVDFYPGGFSTRYGGGIAGVIELTGRKAKSDRFQGSVDLNMLDATLLIEGPVNEKVSFLASGRRNFVGDILDYYFDNADPDQFQGSVAPFYWDYLLRTDVDVNNKHDLFVTLFGARDSMGVFYPRMRGGSSEIDDDVQNFTMKILFHMLTVGLESELNDKWSNSLRLSGTYADSRFSAFGLVTADESARFGYLRNQLSFQANEKVKINAGADIELLNLDLYLTIPGADNLINRDTTEDWLFGVAGAYLNMEYKPIEKLQIIPGLRFDFYPELDYNGSVFPEFWPYESMEYRHRFSGEPALRMNARYEHSNEHIFKGAIGTYSQTPQPIGQVIHPTWGEPDMPATKSAQYVAGYEWYINDLVSLDMQTYLNRQWDIPRTASPLDYDPDASEQKLYYDDGKGRMYGLEVMLRHDQSEKFFGWLAYTLSRSERWDRALEEYVIFNQDETHHLQLLGSWHLDNDWDVGFRARYVTGKPTTPVKEIVEYENGNYIGTVPGEKNSDRLDPFFQLDLRIDKKWVFKKWMFSTYLDLQNIFWFYYKSPEFTTYNYNYKHKSTFAMPPLVSLGCKMEF
ncbi:MAG: TonB family protein [Chitinispirillaceae bacterium]